MTKETVKLWNADCTPVLDEDGVQVEILAADVVFERDAKGQIVFDACGNPVWTVREDDTTTEGPFKPIPPVFLPPKFSENVIPWKVLAIAAAVVILVGWFASC